MGEAVVHRGMRLLARPHALEPIRHMFERAIIDAHGRQFSLTGKQNVFRLSLGVDVVVVLVRTLLFYKLIARAALISDVKQCGVLAHVAVESRSVVSKAGRVADQKAFGIIEQGMKRVGILAAVFPGVNTAV